MCTQMHAIRTNYLHDRLAETAIACPEPSGAFYLFPDFGRWRRPLAAMGVDSSDDLAVYLLEEYELATLPGSAFGASPETLCLRLSTSYLDASSDEKAAGLVEAFRTDPDPVRFIEDHHPHLREAASRLLEFIGDLERRREDRKSSKRNNEKSSRRQNSSKAQRKKS
jgi:hypothetical protein